MTMTDKAKEARKQYYRQWYRQNKVKAQEYQNRYWAKKAAAAEAAEQTPATGKN